MLVPVPLIIVHEVSMPGGRVPPKLTVPATLTVYPESPFVTVAVHVSDTPTVPVAGEQPIVVVVGV